MSLPQQSWVCLFGSGLCLLLIGGFTTYLLLPQSSVPTPAASDDVSEPEQEEVDADDADAYAWHAPDDYEAEVREYDTVISLPEPDRVGTVPVETALQSRRTVRSFAEDSLSLENVSQMLWAGIGSTSDDEKRTAPSRGGENPTAVFLVASDVADLEPGLYEYLEQDHALGLVREGDFTDDWEDITHQSYPMDAPAVMLITGDMYKQYYRYEDITERLVLQESGHIGQNLYLQAETLGLGLVVMGGFDTVAGQEFLGTPYNEPVVYLVPFGKQSE